MKSQSITVKTKSGEAKTSDVLVPETVNEMLGVMGEGFVLQAALGKYLQDAKRKLKSSAKPRKKWIHLSEGDLTPEQLHALKQLGLFGVSKSQKAPQKPSPAFGEEP